MKKRIPILAILCIGLSAILFVPSGCSLLHPSNKRKVEKKMAKESKAADKEYDLARKQHLKKQKKETLQMMKNTKKSATIVNKPKKRGFMSSKKCR
jgi:hypothetical protein